MPNAYLSVPVPKRLFCKYLILSDFLVAGVRYIAKPTISEALFSYRRAAQLA